MAGHRGLVGSACVRALERVGYRNVLCRTRAELDLTKTGAVHEFFGREKPDAVILAAAKVGGIGANSKFKTEFLLENLKIQNNVIESAALSGTRKLVFLGSSCIYPKNSPTPIKESQLLSGPLEETNDAYALAKIAGLKLCEFFNREKGKAFISVMPTNMYGPNDNYDIENAHVIPAMLGRFIKAKRAQAREVTLWGTGEPKREFLHADDLADAIVFCLRTYSKPETLNIGFGEEIRIRDLAELIKRITGFEGEIRWDTSKPNGVMSKLIDSSRIRALGWKPQINLEDGLRSALDEALRKVV